MILTHTKLDPILSAKQSKFKRPPKPGKQDSRSSKDPTKNMVRVKSSNIWARSIDIKDPKSKVGDMYVQFKGPNGGPGDIYVLYDVPIVLYRRFLTAPSAGHFYHEFFRDKYVYAKLTGDKRTKRKGGVNS